MKVFVGNADPYSKYTGADQVVKKKLDLDASVQNATFSKIQTFLAFL